MSQRMQTQSTLDESFVLSLPDDPASGKDWYLWAGVLALLVFVAFFPAVSGQFLWDDDHHVGLISSLHLDSLEGLAKIWMPQAATPQYYPLTFTSFWLEHFIWNDNPLGYHLGNLILHAGSAVLVWRLLRRLKVPGAWLASAIWAVHPLQAESVCWISERKNVLCGLLFFASIWFYLEYADLADGPSLRTGNKKLAYGLSWLLFVLALFAKTVACAMPVAMAIILWWKGRKLNRKTLGPLIPFLAAGLALGAITVYLETSPNGNVEARGPDWNLSPIQRLLIAGRGVWFYVAKLVWPTQLTFSYPRPVLSPSDVIQWLYVIGAIAAVAIVWIGRNRWGRGPLAAVLYYGITLFPALGFINIFPMRYSFVADHFQYLSGLSLIVLAVATATVAMRRLKFPPAAAAAVAAVFVGLLVVPSWIQAHIYESPLTLWQDTLEKNPQSWMAADNLGIELIKVGEQKQQSAAGEQLAGQTDAANADAQDAQDNFQTAENLFKHVLQIRPGNYGTYNSLGLLYRQTDRWQPAETELKTAVEMDQKDDKAHQLTAPYVNYANVLAHNHPDADVRPLLDQALDLAGQPRVKATDLAMAHLAYGDYWFARAAADSRTHSDQEAADLNEAVQHYNSGLQTVATDVPGLFNLGRAYQRLGLIDEQNADRAKAAGNLVQAAELEDKSYNVDDAQAMQFYLAATQNVQNYRHPGALEGIGELLIRRARESESQADAINDLLRALSFFQNAMAINPNIGGAAENLAALSRHMMDEGQAVRRHETTWAPLHEKLTALSSGPITTAAASDADQAAEAALWPLPPDHPLRQPLFDLRLAIKAYLSPTAPADAAHSVQETAANLLKDWNLRDPSVDAVADAMAAATCFAGALTADDHSAPAWQCLQSEAAVLKQAMATKPDVPGAQKALDQSLNVLDQHRAATQPATLPSR
jgi:protein O-mannosyl-transferase